MKPLHKLSCWLVASFCMCAGVATAQPEQAAVAQEDSASLTAQIEELKAAALELESDLLNLEEELVYPADTRMLVFVSMEVGEWFRLDSIKLEIDDQLVASHLYSDRENSALSRGGVQRLYIGNLRSDSLELTAYFTGIGPHNREYKRAATTVLEKQDAPHTLEIRIQDSTSNMQPEFDFKEWHL